MSRPRAGHAWSWRYKPSGESVALLMLNDGRWVGTGTAKGWHRCDRCRRPEQTPYTAPDGRSVCNICYWYHCIPVEEFWARKDEYLFPYTIGARAIEPVEPQP
jgi:hypothetical protein